MSKPEEKDSSKHILIIEDDKDLVELFSAALDIDGYIVDGVPTLDRGRKLLTENQYNILLCDMQVGREHSIAFLREVTGKANPAHVVMISGASHYEMMADELGADFFLAKPIDIPVLLALMERLTDKVPS